MLSALNMVFSRCAMVMTVLPCMSWRVDSSSRDSVSGSRLEVGSSRIRMGESLRKARARASRWACPPLRRAPLSPMTVSYLSGSVSMNSCRCAALAASRLLHELHLVCQVLMFAEMVSWKRCGFCGTQAMNRLKVVKVEG